MTDEWSIEAFHLILDDCDLQDVGYERQWFTWERERLASNNIQERLDRGVSTPGWEDLFPNYSLKHCDHSISDHFPLLINTCGRMTRKENLY